MLMLPAGAQWEGLRLKGEFEVKGVRYPVRWACRQKVNSDGSLTLRHNYKPEQPLVWTTKGGGESIRGLTLNRAPS
jgi:hypothetical protein